MKLINKIIQIKYRLDKQSKISINKLLNSTCMGFLPNKIKKQLFLFTTKSGKLLRPIFFILGLQGYTKKRFKNIYESAISIEMLHNFALIHDDIVDNSLFRRNKKSLHNALKTIRDKNNYYSLNLAMLIGDLLYPFGLKLFLSIKAPEKEILKAYNFILNTSIYTSCGEILDVLLSSKKISEIKKEEIYLMYNFKTSYYSFICPLSIGALLSNKKTKELNLIYGWGRCFGLAFQLLNDLVEINRSLKIKKNIIPNDIKEKKKTLLIWHLYKNANKKEKTFINNIFTKKTIVKNDWILLRRLIEKYNITSKIKKEIDKLNIKSSSILKKLSLKNQNKILIQDFCNYLLNHSENL